ncbi:MAG: SPOR domain-containing protein [Alphaproteobacteria bacterium]
MAALGGCVAIPAGITAASAAFDGMSYAATGKAPHDHALSAVTGEDCAVWRVVKEKPVCVEPRGTGAREVVYAPGNGALAFAPPAMTPIGVSPTPVPEKAPEAEIATESLPPPAPAPQMAAIAPTAPLAIPPVATSAPPLRASNPPKATVPATARTASLAPVPASGNGRKVLVVLGSFQDADRAAAASSSAKGTRVIAATVDGRKMYRVVAGPFEAQQAESVRRSVSEKAWLLPI